MSKLRARENYKTIPSPSHSNGFPLTKFATTPEASMTIRKEQEYLLQETALRQLRRGMLDRRQFIQRTVMTGLGLAGVGALARGGAIGTAFAQDRPLTPTFYQWIEDLHPGIPTVNGQFPGINYQI